MNNLQWTLRKLTNHIDNLEEYVCMNDKDYEFLLSEEELLECINLIHDGLADK